jgi:hypothetical protein
METGLHFEAFYVSWIFQRDTYYLQKGGQDLRQKGDSAVNNFVQGQYASNTRRKKLAHGVC